MTSCLLNSSHTSSLIRISCDAFSLSWDSSASFISPMSLINYRQQNKQIALSSVEKECFTFIPSTSGSIKSLISDWKLITADCTTLVWNLKRRIEAKPTSSRVEYPNAGLKWEISNREMRRFEIWFELLVWDFWCNPGSVLQHYNYFHLKCSFNEYLL